MISKKTISEIVKNRKSRECVFWGFHEKRLNELQSEGVEIKKIFTGNKKLLKESEQYIDYKLLKGEAKKYFIIFPFWFKEKSTQDFYKHTLKEFGYLSNDWLTLEPTVNWNTGENKGFADIYGNKCSGIPGGVKQLFRGIDNDIQISNIKNSGNISIIVEGNNNKIVIGDETKFRGLNNIIHCIGDNISIYIGKNVSAKNIEIEAFSNSVLSIGERTTIAENNLFYMHPYSKIVLGSNCKTSFNVLFQTGDGHSIFSVITGKNINSSKKNLEGNGFLAEIILGEHVWVCRDSQVLSSYKKTEIREGSIVGMRSFVKGTFPNNCIIAGVPGKVVKENVSWADKPRSDDIGDCKGYVNLTKYC